MAVDIAKTGPGGDFLSDASDLQVAEWSCRALIQSLLRAPPASTENETLIRARKMLEAGADGLLQRIAEAADTDEKIDAYGNVEFLIDACLRIGLIEAESAEAIKASDLHKKGLLGRVAIILMELYKIDPIQSGETTEVQLEDIINQRLGAGTTASKSTLRRARALCWPI